MKAGGPNYVLQFLNLTPYLEENGLEPNLLKVEQYYQEAYDKEFSQAVDRSLLRGQHNVFRYLKVKGILLLVDKETNDQDLYKVKLAGKVMGIPLEVKSLPRESEITDFIDEYSECFSEDYRIRSLCAKLPTELLKYCHERAIHIASRPPHASGRVELLNYIEEQSISDNYHRYGNTMGNQPGDFNFD